MLEIINVNGECGTPSIHSGVEVWKDGHCIFKIEHYECCAENIDKLLSILGIKVDKVSRERRMHE